MLNLNVIRKRIILIFFLVSCPAFAEGIESMPVGTHNLEKVDNPRSKVCLNEWWDFLPILSESGLKHSPPGPIPDQGWIEKGILVPGSWTRGEQKWIPAKERHPWETWGVFDSYGFPAEWNDTNTAWYRRTFPLEAVESDRRYFLYFGGILRESWVFVNGKEVGHAMLGIMPKEYDITTVLKTGQNEIVVYITDYRRDENGRTFVPTGADQMSLQKGIWQDVFLMTRPDARVQDITIRTSVRNNELELLVELVNNSLNNRTLEPLFTVSHKGTVCFTFTCDPVELPAGESRSLTLRRPWADYLTWSPRTPELYDLDIRLYEKSALIDDRSERFGFREVWTEGPHLMLNGTPVHLFGDWGHRNSFDNFRPEYIRQWYGMMKDCNMNYMRTHTFPHPRIQIDLADEMGILVSLESAWFFTHGQALDKPETWENAQEHVREMIKWYKNHPSIILWSVGNEVRWGWNRNATIEHMPMLRKLYEKLDPTRIAYHDGDSSLWDERSQPLISRHYGYECTGEDWWDRSRPLHVGEVGKWHFAQPIDNAILGDDRIFASYEECARTVALECANLAEQARANEVCCFFPWNLSCLDNYRPWPKERQFEWSDWSLPGLKPLRSGAYGSEFTWWEPESKGYSPGPGFEIMKHAFRPFAIIVREKRNQVFDQAQLSHSVTLVNDTGGDITAELSVRLWMGDTLLWKHHLPVTIDQGYTLKVPVVISVPQVKQSGLARLETLVYDKSKQYDRHERTIRIISSSQKASEWQVGKVALYGKGDLAKVLSSHKVDYIRIQELSRLDPDMTPLLIIEKNAMIAGSNQNQHLDRFVKQGGRVIVLEQSASPFPDVRIENKPVEKCHIRGGQEDVLAGFTAEDFEFWGDDPFGRVNSDAWVSVRPYKKPATGNIRILLHSGYGFFGNGGLFWTPLFESRIGEGMVIACQLLLSEHIDTVPAARELLQQMLEYASKWQPAPQRKVHVSDHDASQAFVRLGVVPEKSANVIIVQAKSKNLPVIAQRVRQGATAILYGITPSTVRSVSSAFDIEVETVDLGPVYNLIRAKEDLLLDGLSNQETYWLDKGQYSPGENENHAFTEFLLKCDQGEELLISETQSCWKEFHLDGARNERFRMSVITHYLWHGARPHGAALIRIPMEKGTLVLCQLPLPEKGYWKSDILWSHLLSNLGVQSTKSLFEGPAVIAGSQRSEGYPNRIHYLLNPDQDLVDNVLKISKPQEYRLPNQALENGFHWETADCSTQSVQGRIA